MIVSLVNVKGGVGKTTTSVNLGAVFAQTGLKVLLVDLDPQASASYSLGVAARDGGVRIGSVLIDRVPASEAIRQTSVTDLDLMVGDLRLAAADITLARKRDAVKLLSQALASVRRRYDVIVVDSPPGLSLFTVMALHASQAYIVPTTAHDLALDALDRFFEAQEELREELGRRPRLLGILLTMVDHRIGLTEDVIRELRRQYGKEVFRTEVPVNVRLTEAAAYGCTIFDYQSWSSGAAAYRRLGGEVLGRMRSSGLL